MNRFNIGFIALLSCILFGCAAPSVAPSLDHLTQPLPELKASKKEELRQFKYSIPEGPISPMKAVTKGNITVFDIVFTHLGATKNNTPEYFVVGYSTKIFVEHCRGCEYLTMHIDPYPDMPKCHLLLKLKRSGNEWDSLIVDAEVVDVGFEGPVKFKTKGNVVTVVAPKTAPPKK